MNLDAIRFQVDVQRGGTIADPSSVVGVTAPVLGLFRVDLSLWPPPSRTVPHPPRAERLGVASESSSFRSPRTGTESGIGDAPDAEGLIVRDALARPQTRGGQAYVAINLRSGRWEYACGVQGRFR